MSKNGYWIPVSSYDAYGGCEEAWGDSIAFYYCSECKEQAYADECGNDILSKYCPNCGKEMANGQNNQNVEFEAVKYGTWEERGNNSGCKCSVCGYPIRYKNAIPDTSGFYCRCPKCGAIMQGGVSDDRRYVH